MTKDQNLKSSLNKEVREGLLDDSVKRGSDLITCFKEAELVVVVIVV